MAYVAVKVGHINSSVFESIAIVTYNAIIVFLQMQLVANGRQQINDATTLHSGSSSTQHGKPNTLTIGGMRGQSEVGARPISRSRGSPKSSRSLSPRACSSYM